MDREELRRHMAQHPNSVSFNEARRVLEALGWELHRIKGSHHIFANGESTVVLPHRRPTILQAYVRNILRVTAIGGGDGGDNPGSA